MFLKDENAELELKLANAEKTNEENKPKLNEGSSEKQLAHCKSDVDMDIQVEKSVICIPRDEEKVKLLQDENQKLEDRMSELNDYVMELVKLVAANKTKESALRDKIENLLEELKSAQETIKTLKWSHKYEEENFRKKIKELSEQNSAISEKDKIDNMFCPYDM